MPRLHSEITVATPYEQVRRMYERADGLAELSPSFFEFEFEAIEGNLDPLTAGTRFRAIVRPFTGVIELSGVVEIIEITFDDAGGYIEDTVIDGPFEVWRHRRSLQAVGETTHIRDDLIYRSPPGGILGELGATIVLRGVFADRRRRLQARFGVPG